MKKRYYIASYSDDRASEIAEYSKKIKYDLPSVCIVDCVLWEAMLYDYLDPEKQKEVKMRAMYLED